MMRILLVDPDYRNGFPPLGLMKLSTYHKIRGDFVRFVRGRDRMAAEETWDRVYVSATFTFSWKVILETIDFYRDCVQHPGEIVAGGVMATLLGDELEEHTGARAIRGLLDKPGMLDSGDRTCIDALIPDYQMLEDIEHEYALNDSYIAYATRGCPNDCPFCAVSAIEPEFVHYLPLKRHLDTIDKVFGPKQHLVLLDNNVLASDQFERIVGDIIDSGFGREARLNGRVRHVDFNQGLDIRLLTEDKMALLSDIPISPFRLAFDMISLEELYISRVVLASDYGVRNISTYVLYNFEDTPQDFYKRIRTSVELADRLDIQVNSFPMKYIPLNATDRSYVGKHWNRRLLRGVQCILLATRGVVSAKRDFFEAAFGATADEFIEICLMPDDYIIHRRRYETNGANEWRSDYRALSRDEKGTFLRLVGAGKIKDINLGPALPRRVRDLLAHYTSVARSGTR